MPVYKDGKSWRVVVRYNDIKGEKKQTQKRGFKTKRDALAWEREFLLGSEFSLKMKFSSLVSLYLKDLENEVRETTLINKNSKIDNWILPYFNDLEVEAIDSKIIRDWQNRALKAKNPRTDEKYSVNYLKSIYSQLVGIFNFAVNHYDLRSNPCTKAGNFKKTDYKEMKIWTLEEFNRFIEVIEDPQVNIGFYILFWCGLRTGELLALTREDVDLEKKTIKINKSYQRIKKRDIITIPKTPKSVRTITIPNNLAKMLENYFRRLYDLQKDERIFKCGRHAFRDALRFKCEQAGVKRIRVHDLRHSHVSYLINNNVNILAISKRVGHSNVEMTLNKYSHLYQSTEDELIDFLNNGNMEN